MLSGGILSGEQNNYDLNLKQRQEISEKQKRKVPEKVPKIPSRPTSNGWPVIWNINDTIPEFANLRYPPATPKDHDTRFQRPIDIFFNNFKVYVNEDEYFMSNLSPISADWLQDLKDNNKVINQDNYNIRVAKMENSNYFNMLFATYIATFLSGISSQNLTDGNTPNVIKSIAHFHIYYTIVRFMKNPSLMEEYITPEVIKAVSSHIPIKYSEFESQARDGDGNYFDILAAINYSKEDYKSMIPYKSNGIMEIGRGSFQLSLEVYVWSILGAQAYVRWSIVGKGAMSLQSQEQFRTHVNSLLVIPSVKELVSDMWTAVHAIHVILDTAIIPGVSLIPSSLVILKEPISEYNNILLTASSNMSFGKNSEVNRVKRKVNKVNEPSPKQEPTERKKSKSVPLPNKVKENPERSDDSNNYKVNPVILFIPGIILGIFFSRYK